MDIHIQVEMYGGDNLLLGNAGHIICTTPPVLYNSFIPIYKKHSDKCYRLQFLTFILSVEPIL